MVLSAARPDAGRRRDRVCRRRRDSLADRHDLARAGLAGAAAAVHARAGRQRLDRGVRGADDAARVIDGGTRPGRAAAICSRSPPSSRFAWLVIRLVTSVIRNAFIVRLVSLSAWLVAALSILGQLDPVDRRARLGLDRARRPAADAAAADQARRAAGRGAVADQHRQQFRGKPDHAIQRPDAVDPGAAGQDDPAGADGLRRRGRDERGRHQSLGAGDLLRRGRRRHRLRPAEDRRQFHQRHHPAGGQIGEARRSRHHRRQLPGASAR